MPVGHDLLDLVVCRPDDPPRLDATLVHGVDKDGLDEEELLFRLT
jgi:hypothetical protein